MDPEKIVFIVAVAAVSFICGAAWTRRSAEDGDRKLTSAFKKMGRDVVDAMKDTADVPRD